MSWEREKYFRDRFPHIDWNSPVIVKNTVSEVLHYGCRYCIAMYGLKGSKVHELPITFVDWLEHIRDEHGIKVAELGLSE